MTRYIKFFAFAGERGTVMRNGRLSWGAVRCHLNDLPEAEPLRVAALKAYNRLIGKCTK